MTRNELYSMVFVVARMGANWPVTKDLCRKVRTEVGSSPSTRLVAAVTIFHVWLLMGRPDRTTWRYSARVRYSIQVLEHFNALQVDPPRRAVPSGRSVVVLPN
ncbi:MAG: hypothetical protein NDI82_02695 [Anaeromyxobacteraceae bacterium]|nr:hypothetical protein [Anaeromyxobacteraceae bacterium]